MVVSADAGEGEGRRSVDAPRGSSVVDIYGEYYGGDGETLLLSHLRWWRDRLLWGSLDGLYPRYPQNDQCPLYSGMLPNVDE